MLLPVKQKMVKMEEKASIGGEIALLRRIRARAGGLRTSALRLGIGDDCALLATRAGEELAVTTDLTIEGRHFRRDWHSPEQVGHRTLMRGLSDLAAMGARPLAAFLSLALPRELTISGEHGRSGQGSSWMDRFYEGFLALAEANRTPLGGGDLSEAPLAVADIVLVGSVPAGEALLRSGARVGDRICVTGRLGGGVAALYQLSERAAARPGSMPHVDAGLVERITPTPRLAQGRRLRQSGLATAAMDLSDGLSTDLARLCEESSVGAEIELDRLPVHPLASPEQALHGGDDYELLFTIGPKARLPRSIAGVALTQIGRIVAPPGGPSPVTLRHGSAVVPLTPQGWEHFS